MIGGPYQGASETMNTVHSNHADLSTLITILITEIRTTLNTRIDILNEKINLKNEENEILKTEVKKLKQIISRQEQTIADLTNKQPSFTRNNITSANPAIPQTQIPVQKHRGIRAHNLILHCPNIEGEPKQFVEELFQLRFHRKPSINAVKVINATTRGSHHSNQPEFNTRGEASTSSATTDQTESCKILVTLNSVWEARAIYMERIPALRNTGIYIDEDLNREESLLFFMARKLKKKQLISSTWTTDGEVYIKENVMSMPRILHPNDQILDQLKENTETKSHENVEGNGKFLKQDEAQMNTIDLNDNEDLQESTDESSEEYDSKKKQKKKEKATRKSERHKKSSNK